MLPPRTHHPTRCVKPERRNLVKLDTPECAVRRGETEAPACRTEAVKGQLRPTSFGE